MKKLIKILDKMKIISKDKFVSKYEDIIPSSNFVSLNEKIRSYVCENPSDANPDYLSVLDLSSKDERYHFEVYNNGGMNYQIANRNIVDGVSYLCGGVSLDGKLRSTKFVYDSYHFDTFNPRLNSIEEYRNYEQKIETFLEHIVDNILLR